MLSIVGAINETIHRYPQFEITMTGGDAHTFEPHLSASVEIPARFGIGGTTAFFCRQK